MESDHAMTGKSSGDVPWTADQLEAGIANALADHNVEAVHDMLLVLAVVDAKRAELIFHAIQVGLAIAAAPSSPDQADQ